MLRLPCEGMKTKWRVDCHTIAPCVTETMRESVTVTTENRKCIALLYNSLSVVTVDDV